MLRARSLVAPLALVLAAHLEACVSAATTPRVSATRGAQQNGYASYYSDALAGRATASGEPYRPEALTAAHRSLPLGTEVRVTRTDTGRAVTVRINDRGPYAGAQRIIDLSRAAATTLAMLRAGVVPVVVEVLAVPRRRAERER